MRKIVFLFSMILLSTYTYGQGMSKFSSRSAEVTDASDTKKVIDCNCDFVYTDYRFFMNCKEKSIYTFLLPGSEFMNLGIVVLHDTGFIVDLQDSTGAAMPSKSIPDSTQVNNIGVIYETYDAYRKMQYIQRVETDGVILIKRDKTQIKFKFN